MTRVLVGIPWRPTSDRQAAHDATVAHYREILPHADLVEVDTRHKQFCLAACRNEIVRRAQTGGYDVAVLADADTLPEQAPLVEAIEAAATDWRVHLPYTEYRTLTAAGTEQYTAGTPLADCDHVTVPEATSGVYVTRPDVWWACGAQDERYRGWGFEDYAWLIAHKTLLGAKPVRHTGRVYALYHPPATKAGKQYDANETRYKRYLAAAENGDVHTIRRLVQAPPTEPRAIIIAAGDGTRWGNYLGTPKHLAWLCGERILHRAVRLARQYTNDVRVVVADPADTRYHAPGAQIEPARLNPANGDADKFLSSRHLWAKDTRTVILYGDVWFSDDAMRQIMSTRPYKDGWHAFVRFDPSKITGREWGENFAHAIDPQAHNAYEANLHRLVQLQQAGQLHRSGGWEQYRAMAGAADDELTKHRNLGHATVIDDWTDDFDFPGDWEMWCWQWAHADPATRPPNLDRGA